MIKDKLVTGAVIGTATFISQNLYALGAKAFNIPTLTYVDYGRILLLSKVMKGTIAVIIGLIGHLIWEIILGVIFVYIKQFKFALLYGCRPAANFKRCFFMGHDYACFIA